MTVDDDADSAGRKIVVATTEMVNGSSLLSSLGPPVQ